MPRASVRGQLIDAALDVFYREGFHAAGIERVLAVAGVSKMALYRHFRSKDELILAALRRRDEAFRHWLMTTVERVGAGPEERLLAVFDVLGTWFRGEAPRGGQFYGCMFVNAAAEYHSREHPIHALAAEHKRLMTDDLERLARAVGAPAPRPLAERLALLVEGAIATAHVTGRPDAAHHAREMARLVIRDALDQERGQAEAEAADLRA
jgi:AcrR family transcriptional regulator